MAAQAAAQGAARTTQMVVVEAAQEATRLCLDFQSLEEEIR